MLLESHMKFQSPQNISEALQQNRAEAFSKKQQKKNGSMHSTFLGEHNV